MPDNKGPIIFLEDDKDEQELLKEVIAQMQIPNPPVFFSDGVSFLDYLRTTKERPFLIISDVNVPLLNGLEVKKIINDDDLLRKKSIPFVFLSTTAERKAVEQAYDLNCQGFFVKQYTVSEIEKQLQLIFNYWKNCRHINS